jgi:CheY-like chemotaxis protein
MDGGGDLRIVLSRVENESDLRCAVCNRAIAGEWLRLEVADTGSGISNEVLSHVFEPFFTTKEVGRGSGLGLSQVAGIVAQHEGHVRIETRVGQGTTVFCYFLPLGRECRESKSIQVAAKARPGSLVLLVGNDPVENSATRSMLERLGYGSLVALDGHAAIETLDSHRDEVTLVLADAVLPDMDVGTLFEHLKSTAPDLRIVVVGSVPLSGKERELLEFGAIDWLQRPFTFNMLSRELAEIVCRMRGRWG